MSVYHRWSGFAGSEAVLGRSLFAMIRGATPWVGHLVPPRDGRTSWQKTSGRTHHTGVARP